MKKTIIYLFIITGMLACNIPANAQESSWRCATPEMNRKALEANPAAINDILELRNFVEQYVEQEQKTDQVYAIPVVFHIVHNYGPENISKEQIEDQIRILNLDFRKLNSDTMYIIDPFKEIAGDSHIEFRLAKIDPDGNCTDGITRTVSDETYNGGEQIKDIAPSWPRAKYLNVWIVARIPGGVAGYAYYPGWVPDGTDGILIDHAYVGSIGTGSSGRARTLTHEIGHYLNLMHPWGDSNDPGLPENCEIDDEVEDTPNTIGHTSCSVYAETCGSLDNVQNYMEYSYCGLMFSEGQGVRMRATLNSSICDRNNLWSESNLIATGVFDENSIAVCEPVADFDQNIKVACTGREVQYYDLSYNTDTIYNWIWAFDGGTPELSDEPNPVIVYQQPGHFSTGLTVSNPSGSDTKEKEGSIAVYSHSDALEAPYSFNFEDGAFPGLTGIQNNDFYLVNNGSTYWMRTNSAAAEGSYSIRIRNSLNDDNISNSFYTPLMAIDTNSFPLTVYFKTAYAKTDNTTNDVLRIYCSYDCGETWKIKFYLSGNGLKTTDDFQQNGTFIPTSEEWRQDSFSISRPANLECNSIRLRFETISHGGNCLYIDDIQMLASVSAINVKESEQLSVYPNPFTDKITIDGIEAPEVSISIFDVSGRKVGEKVYAHVYTSLEISSLMEQCTSGTYFLHISYNGLTTTKIINRN